MTAAQLVRRDGNDRLTEQLFEREHRIIYSVTAGNSATRHLPLIRGSSAPRLSACAVAYSRSPRQAVCRRGLRTRSGAIAYVVLSHWWSALISSTSGARGRLGWERRSSCPAIGPRQAALLGWHDRLVLSRRRALRRLAS